MKTRSVSFLTEFAEQKNDSGESSLPSSSGRVNDQGWEYHSHVRPYLRLRRAPATSLLREYTITRVLEVSQRKTRGAKTAGFR